MKKYIPFLFVLLLFGCELIVDVDVPFKQPQLVLNSFFNPDSVWSATLSLNRYILSDTPYVKIEDAIVVMYQNDSPIDTLIHQHDGFYKAKTNKPVVGTEYEIRASAANYETVSSRSTIPIPAQITHVEMENGNTPDDPGTIIKLTFNDNAAETNYYQVNVELESEWYNPDDDKIYTSRQPLSIESNNLITQNENASWGSGIVVKDVLFNGKEVTLSVKAMFWNLEDFGTTIILLQTLSEDCYKYKTTLQLQNETSGDPFAQPVNVQSNIENGFGIFAGYSQSTFIHSNPKPIISGMSPSKGRIGDHVIISGENLQGGSVIFSATKYQTYATTVRSTDSEIEVIIPDLTITGKFAVYTSHGVAVSDFDFEVIN